MNFIKKNKLILISCISILGIFYFISYIKSTFNATNNILCKYENTETKFLINNKKIDLEIACSAEKKERGLMYRKMLPKNSGMIFVFDTEGVYPFWMKDTYVDLDLGYINKNGILTEVRQLNALDVTPQYHKYKVNYILEVNKDWFKNNNFKVGDKLFLEINNEK